jgi:tetraacyldisaccharide 4'-kinase
LETDPGQRLQCEQKFNKEARENLFFSGLAYGQLVNLLSSEVKPLQDISAGTTIFLLTGIANPQPLVAYLGQYSQKIRHYNYSDHYNFKPQDIKRLINTFNQDPSADKLIITTEKDAQRLRSNVLKELLLNLSVFYLPVKIALQHEDKATFDQKILNYVSGNSRDR